jgi:hypothetical protein
VRRSSRASRRSRACSSNARDRRDRSTGDLVARAEKEEWSYHDFLSTLVAEEVAHRQQARIQCYAQRSRFPFLKTVDDFNFTYRSTVKLQLLGSALLSDFVTDGRNLIFRAELRGSGSTSAGPNRSSACDLPMMGAPVVEPGGSQDAPTGRACDEPELH